MPPLVLRPFVQFGHAQPGGIVRYNQVLLNHFSADTPVGIQGSSYNMWPVHVTPQFIVVHPNISTTVAVTVAVPMSPTRLVDVERTTAVGGLSPVVTATAYMVTFAGRHPFSDLQDGHWADDAVQYLFDKGAISGYSDGSFRPNDNVTRAQFAKMLVNAMGWDLENPTTPTFTDVAPDNWAYAFIETAVAHGVISGYADGSFRPVSSITRAQVAKMVVTARGWESVDSGSSTFTDLTTSDWAFNYAQTMNAAGVMSGYSDGTFRPYATATRAQIAKILTYSLFSEPVNQ